MNKSDQYKLKHDWLTQYLHDILSFKIMYLHILLSFKIMYAVILNVLSNIVWSIQFQRLGFWDPLLYSAVKQRSIALGIVKKNLADAAQLYKHYHNV